MYKIIVHAKHNVKRLKVNLLILEFHKFIIVTATSQRTQTTDHSYYCTFYIVV